MAAHSYSALEASVLGRFREFSCLYHQHARGIPEQVRVLTERLSGVEQQLEAALGRRVCGLRMLEVGPGQRQPQQMYFAARGNEVVGIDLDVIPRAFEWSAYLDMLRKNGGIRTLKTLGRKVLGLDAAYQRELCKRLGVSTMPALPVRQMDASAVEFPNEHFDTVYSFSAFEHFSDPEGGLREIVRVLRPGGAAYVALHLYTSDSGIHDPRIFAGERADVPLWSHLRPQHAHRVRPNAYLNELRLADWQVLFDAHLPGAQVSCQQNDREWQAPELEKLRQAGELTEYSDEELLTVDLCALWIKPAAAEAFPTFHESGIRHALTKLAV